MGIMLVVLAILFLFVLTYLVSLLSNKFKIPVAIVGIIAGLLLSGVFKFAQSLQLPADYLPTLALLAFVLLVFDASAEIKLKTADSTAFGALGFVALFACVLFVFFSLVSFYSIKLSVLSSVILSACVLGVSSELVSKLKTSATVRALLNMEEYWSSPVVLLAPLIIAVFAPQVPTIFVSDLANLFFASVIKLLISIASGVFIAIVLMRLLLHEKTEWVPATVIGAVFIAFGLGYYAGGYGIFSVAAFGFFFANAFASVNKIFVDFHNNLARYSGIFSAILFGSIVRIPFTAKFLGISLVLYAVYLALRYASIHICHRKNSLSLKEEAILMLHAPNSTAVCAIFLFITLFPPITVPLNELYAIITIGLMFLIYSNLLSFGLYKFPKLLEQR